MNHGFIEVEPKEGEYIHGDGLLGTIAIQPSGDWSNFLPSPELQNRGFETNACATEASEHCTEILQRKKWEDATDYSVRFVATLSGTKEKGGNDFNTVAETLRKEGCPQEVDWPFGAVDFDAFYTPPPDKVKKLAKLEFAKNSFGHSWITDTSPEGLKSALQYSPLALAVYAWDSPDANGIIHRSRPQNNHAICVYGYEDGKYWKIFDSYPPYEKKLAWDFGFGIGKRFTLDRRIPTSPDQHIPSGFGFDLAWVRWDIWIAWCRRVLGL